MEDSEDPDQLASNEANWSGSTLFFHWQYEFISIMILHHLIDWKLEVTFKSLDLYLTCRNSVDSNQLASNKASRSGSTLFCIHMMDLYWLRSSMHHKIDWKQV